MRKCANISPFMRRPLVIYSMTLQLLHSEFSYKRGKFDFLFYQCRQSGGRGEGVGTFQNPDGRARRR
jgi:hypothetical protein